MIEQFLPMSSDDLSVGVNRRNEASCKVERSVLIHTVLAVKIACILPAFPFELVPPLQMIDFFVFQHSERDTKRVELKEIDRSIKTAGASLFPGPYQRRILSEPVIGSC